MNIEKLRIKNIIETYLEQIILDASKHGLLKLFSCLSMNSTIHCLNQWTSVKQVLQQQLPVCHRCLMF